MKELHDIVTAAIARLSPVASLVLLLLILVFIVATVVKKTL